jgi:hypothetical protein
MGGAFAQQIAMVHAEPWIKVKNPDSPAMIRAREAEW